MIKYHKSATPEILPTRNLEFKDKHVVCTICQLLPNNSYQFELAAVHEVGIVGKYTQIKACTGKICIHTYYYV